MAVFAPVGDFVPTLRRLSVFVYSHFRSISGRVAVICATKPLEASAMFWLPVLVSAWFSVLFNILHAGTIGRYSTVTDLARFLGLSTSVPRNTATW